MPVDYTESHREIIKKQNPLLKIIQYLLRSKCHRINMDGKTMKPETRLLRDAIIFTWTLRWKRKQNQTNGKYLWGQGGGLWHELERENFMALNTQ